MTFIVLTAIVLFVLQLTRARRNPDYRLVWSDEFDGPAGESPDATKWTHEVGGHGFGNNELQSYTSRPENSALDGRGNLVIKAVKRTVTGPDGISRDYTSARLITKGKFAHAYGRFEARIKLPFGQGIWPAFWAMGDNIDEVGWPECGEIDIMENIGREPFTNHGSLHGPDYWGGNSKTGTVTLADGSTLSEGFHTYAIEWEPNEIRFYFDDQLYFTKNAADMNGGRWVFNRPFFILLNVAVGGNWPGSPDETTKFPQEMLVDYVRVYEKKTA